MRQMGYLLGHVQELVQVHTSVGELPEGTLLLDLNVRLWRIHVTLALKHSHMTQGKESH